MKEDTVASDLRTVVSDMKTVTSSMSRAQFVATIKSFVDCKSEVESIASSVVDQIKDDNKKRSEDAYKLFKALVQSVRSKAAQTLMEVYYLDNEI